MAVILLTACSDLDEFELLELSHEAEAEVDSIVIEVEGEIGLVGSEESEAVDVPIIQRIEVESEGRRRSDSLQGVNETTVYARGDGYEYTEKRVDGIIVDRFYLEVDDDDDEEESVSRFLTGSISESTVYESSSTSMDDGYRLEFVLNMDGVSSFLEEIFDGGVVIDQVDESEDEENLDNTMIVYIDEDYFPVSVEVNLVEMDVILGETETVMTIDLMIEAVQVGGVVVDFPDWLDSDIAWVTAADLVGAWEQADVADDEYLLFFQEDGLGTVLTDPFGWDNLLGHITLDRFSWEVLNNVLYLDFEDREEIARYALILEDEALTMENLDRDIESDYHFFMTDDDFFDFMDSVVEAREALWEERGFELPADGLIGTWMWVDSDNFQLIFNEDGTGEWVGFDYEFTWEVSGDEVTMTGISTPRWNFEIIGRYLTISSIDYPGLEHRYVFWD